MKRIYFVRHGSTEGNESESFQFANISLSEKGRKQGVFLAERLAKIPFDALVASDMERAHETARIIGKKTGHEVVLSSLFQEVRRPSFVWGKPRKDPEVMKVMKESYDNFFTGGEGHQSDEENYYDLKKRAEEALAYLISRPEETVVVATHGVILKMLFAVMFLGDGLTPQIFKRIYDFMLPLNTSITWCEYDNESHPGKWNLITWNDHAHLG